MPPMDSLPVIGAAILIAFLVVLLAATRKSLSSEDPQFTSKYPYGYWMSLGISLGVAFGILLGWAVRNMSGGILIGVGAGLFLGKFLDKRKDRDIREFSEKEKQDRLKRATWGLIMMILLILGTVAATVLSLLEQAAP